MECSSVTEFFRGSDVANLCCFIFLLPSPTVKDTVKQINLRLPCFADKTFLSVIITFGAIHTRQSTGLTRVMAVTVNGEYIGHITAEILFKVNYFYDH